MTTLTLRGIKAASLIHSELDANFAKDVKAEAAGRTLTVDDNRATLVATGTIAFTLPSYATITSTTTGSDTGEWEFTMYNEGSGVISIGRAGSDTINGTSTSITLDQYRSITIKTSTTSGDFITVATGEGTSSGTWTPAIQGSTTPGTPTYLLQRGDWYSIEDLVFANCWLQISAKGGVLGNMQLTGLPFSSSSPGASVPCITVGNQVGILNNAIVMGIVTTGTSFVALRKILSGGGSSLNATDITDTFRLEFSIVYRK